MRRFIPSVVGMKHVKLSSHDRHRRMNRRTLFEGSRDPVHIVIFISSIFLILPQSF